MPASLEVNLCQTLAKCQHDFFLGPSTARPKLLIKTILLLLNQDFEHVLSNLCSCRSCHLLRVKKCFEADRLLLGDGPSQVQYSIASKVQSLIRDEQECLSTIET